MSTSSSRADELRELVHRQLATLHEPGQELASGGPLDSSQRHSYSRGRWRVERLRLHSELLEPFRQPASGVARDGRCAVVTSGPPGAGKSYAVAEEVGSLSSWRRIDADDFKVRLIEHLVDQEMADYAPTLGQVLRDGKPVMPMELAALVHTESAYLSHRALGLTLARGEDVIVEGTLSWEPLVAQYSEELAGAGYEDLTVIDLTTPQPIALERAKSRWWEGRLREGLGGRFTMPSAIDQMYDPTGASRCSRNADALVAAAEAVHIDVRLVRPEPPLPPSEEELAG